MKTHIVQVRRRFKESQILLKSENRKAINSAISAIKVFRMELETYISLHPEFLFALQPISVKAEVPRIIKLMVNCSRPFHVGPMAAVAGVLADLAVETMIGAGARIAIVENGGEISASSDETFVISLSAGNHILSNKIGFQVEPSECPMGIATSSATVGHAISFGEADAVTVFADNSGMADAAATAICNFVQGRDVASSVQNGLELVKKFSKSVRGALIVRDKYVGSVGRLPRLVDITKHSDIDLLN